MFSNRLPSTASLRAFESAARHLTCTAAAEELCLSQSAVSKQLRGLEGSLGVELFGRTTQGLELTDAGKKYLTTARGVLSALEAATPKLVPAQPGAQILLLRVLQTLGERWLLPRLNGFLEINPQLDIYFAFSGEMDNQEADGEFRFGAGTWSGHVAHYLFGRELALVCSPQFLNANDTIELKQLASLRRLQHFQVGEHWDEFDRRYPVAAAIRRQQTIRYGYYSLIIRAVISGLGIALVPRVLVNDELANRSLVELAEYQCTSRLGYYFVRNGAVADSPGMNIFTRWLLGQADSERLEHV